MFKTKTMPSSRLYDQASFYKAFETDLRCARSRVVIESPFITSKRLYGLMSAIQRLRRRGATVVINTKPLNEHDEIMLPQAEQAVDALQAIGVKVLMTVGHHRKLAIVDDIIWEGSLNILSQNDSCEFMRRIHSAADAEELIRFIGVRKWL